MRRHGPGSRFRQAAFIDDHGLPAIDFFHAVEQEPTVLDALEIHGDDRGFIVMGQIIQKIGAVQCQRVAVTNDLAEMKCRNDP